MCEINAGIPRLRILEMIRLLRTCARESTIVLEDLELFSDVFEHLVCATGVTDHVKGIPGQSFADDGVVDDSSLYIRFHFIV